MRSIPLSCPVVKSICTTLLGLAAATLLLTPVRAETVRLGGTGAALGSMHLLAQAYRKIDPTFQIDVVPNLGSSGGLKALANGATQVAVISRPLKPDESAAGLHAFEYGRTAFVLASMKDDLRSLSLADIASLYAGKQGKWSDGQPVRLVLRPASDGDTALLASFSPEIKQALAAAMAREGMVSAMTDQDSADAIEKLPGGLGTSSLALLLSEQRRARAIAIDGVEPTVANVASGRYPYFKPLYLVVKADAPSGAMQFLAFVGSSAGRRILTSVGTDVSKAGVMPGGASTTAAAR